VSAKILMKRLLSRSIVGLLGLVLLLKMMVVVVSSIEFFLKEMSLMMRIKRKEEGGKLQI